MGTIAFRVPLQGLARQLAPVSLFSRHGARVFANGPRSFGKMVHVWMVVMFLVVKNSRARMRFKVLWEVVENGLARFLSVGNEN